MTISFSNTPLGDKCLTSTFLKSRIISAGSLLCTIPATELKCRYLEILCSSQRATVASSRSFAVMSHSLLSASVPWQLAQAFISSSLALSNRTGLP